MGANISSRIFDIKPDVYSKKNIVITCSFFICFVNLKLRIAKYWIFFTILIFLDFYDLATHLIVED